MIVKISRPYIKRTNIKGISKHPLYQTWKTMLARCYDPKNISFKHYNSKKITVYEGWRYHFDDFFYYVTNLSNYNVSNIGIGKLTIDRINNNGNYEPGNIRLATPKEQYNNSSASLWKRKKD